MHLVTGGSGFVGSNIAKLLSSSGQKVRVYDIWRSPDLPDDVEFVQGDINDSSRLKLAMEGIQYVHHNVALVPLTKAGDDFWKVNVEGTKAALEAAKEANVKMFAHMSSSAIFGSPTIMPITNDTPRLPVEIYGRAKKAGEDLVLSEMQKGFPAAIIRPRTVIGTGRLGIFEILFDWIKDGANIYIIGKGNELFQFIHVDDISMASIQACLLEKSGVFNMGALEFSTLRQDLEFLCTNAKTGSKVKSLPVKPTIMTLQALDKVGLSPLGPWHYLTYHKPFYFDSKPFYNELQFEPKYTNRKMMVESYDWFCKNFDASKISGAESAHKKPVKQGILKLLKAIS